MENNSTFSRSVAAQQAALTVIEAAQKGEFINGPVFTAPELADAEKELMLKILTAVADKRRRDGDSLDDETVSSMFTFVFARAGEAVTNYVNNQPNEFSMMGLFDGKAPLYTDERITGYFKKLNFPGDCAQNFWDWIHSESVPQGTDPLLALMESLKWCFRITCHIAVTFLRENGFRF
ncbi:MAG: hypothetical protein IKC65_03880 [Lentisphaeria bacterium]|nr:hypothetical protein [Lentisphaeria bacterium]